MATGVISWSKTAASNATADSTVNWAEGMAPSAVNDSARAEMASVAKFRDDIAGTITTGGTSTAYTVTTNQTMTATVNSLLAFVPHATNGATVTIAVDSIGAKPLRSAPGVELPAGVLVAGTPYTATYYTTNSGEWILHGFYGNPYGVPIGGLLTYTANGVPNSSFVQPYGQAISRTTYSTYFSLVGTTFGSGDGSTTFNVVDLRGFLVGFQDNMGGSAANRITFALSGVNGAVIGAAGGAETVTIAQANLPNISPTFTGSQINNLKADSDANTITASGGSFSVPAGSGNSVAALTSTVRPFTPSGTISSINGGVTQTATNNMPPTRIMSCLLRII